MKMLRLDLFGDAALLRNAFADYLEVADGEWALMGTGFTSLDENPGAKTDSETYINEVTASASINGYETQFAYNVRMIPSQDAIYTLWKDARDHAIGDDAQHHYVRVDLFNPIGIPDENHAYFTARKFLVCNEASGITGNGGEKIQGTGTLHAVGDPIQGKFDTVEKEFTAGTFAGKYDDTISG